jgi:serine protease Do
MEERTMKTKQHLTTKRMVLLLLIGTMLAACSADTPIFGPITGVFQRAGQALRYVVSPKDSDLGEAVESTVQTPRSEVVVTSDLETQLENIYETANPAVVSIQVSQLVTVNQPFFPNFPNFPFQLPGFPSEPQEQYQYGQGSGFVVDENGNIVTNYHVAGEADQITVVFADGSSLPAELVGADQDSDLAVIKVDALPDGVQPLLLGNSDSIHVGQFVTAIGNPFGLEGTMTTGIVSALGRTLPSQAQIAGGGSFSIPSVIQTDTAINPGNSGGPLLNLAGEVVGVNTAIESSVQQFAGVGFAIPSNTVARVIPSLISEGEFQHPWIGISGTTLTSDIAAEMNLDRDTRGALVVEVTPGSPAEEAGIQGSDRVMTVNGNDIRIGGDVIVEIDDQPVSDFEDVAAYLTNHGEVGDSIDLVLLRQGEEKLVEVVLAPRPDQITSESTQSGSEAVAPAVWLGIRGLNMSPAVAEAMDLPTEQTGLLIQAVVEGSPAADAGLRGSFNTVILNGQRVFVGGDIIVGVDQHSVENGEELQAALAEHQPGDEVVLSVIRDGKQIELDVTLGEAGG